MPDQELQTRRPLPRIELMEHVVRVCHPRHWNWNGRLVLCVRISLQADQEEKATAGRWRQRRSSHQCNQFY